MLLLIYLILIIMSVFRAKCCSKYFKLKQLYSYLKGVGVVNRIKYVNNEKEDSAIVFIQDWKSSYFKDYFNQQLEKNNMIVVPSSKDKSWIFTPVSRDDLMTIFLKDFKEWNSLRVTSKQDVM